MAAHTEKISSVSYFYLRGTINGARPSLSNPWDREGDFTMRASTITTLIAALGLSVAGCAAIKNSGGGELRGTPDNIDVAHNTITMDGVTIHGGGYPLANLTPGSPYIVRYQKQGDVNVLTDIEPDESNRTHHP